MTFEQSSRRRVRREHSPVAYLVAGSLIAIWGLGMLLDNLGLGEARHYVHRAWPAALVIVGITLLIHRDASRNRYGFWGTVFIVAGLWAYVLQRDWFHVRFWAVFAPVLLVLLGASFVYRALRADESDVDGPFRRRSSTTLPPESRLTTMS